MSVNKWEWVNQTLSSETLHKQCSVLSCSVYTVCQRKLEMELKSFLKKTDQTQILGTCKKKKAALHDKSSLYFAKCGLYVIICRNIVKNMIICKK